MLRGYSFRPAGWALALTAAACVAFVSLGNWQARRAEEKRTLGAQFDQALRSPPIALVPGVDPAGLIHKHVAVLGRFVADHPQLLYDKVRGGRAGVQVVTPELTTGSD